MGAVEKLLAGLVNVAWWLLTHPVAILVLAVLAAGLAVRFTLFSRQQVRRMRWKVRFRLRPGPGWASLGHVVFRWALLAALRHGARARPSMGVMTRLMQPRTEYAVRLGRAQYLLPVYARQEDMAIIMTGPRMYKTAMLGDWLLDWPGAALVTETRPDLLEATAGRRALLGPVEYFNPKGVAGYPSTFGWALTAGCEDPDEAQHRAADLVHAVAVEGDMKWWAEKASAALAAALHAAALTGRDIRHVWQWANGGAQDMITAASKVPGVSQELFGALRELQGTGKTAESIRITMSKALAWVAVPAMRDMVTGPSAIPFDVARWIESRGTIYMLAPGGDDAVTVAPLFRCFAGFVHRSAKAYAQRRPGRRLDPRLGFFLDELHMCPVDLPAWSSDSAASGIMVVAVLHSVGQLLEKYGDAGTKTVMSNMLTKVLLGGIHDTDTLEWASKLCGRLPGDMGDGKADWVAPVEFISRLLLKRALVLRGNLDPVVVRLRPSWTRWEVRLRGVPKPPMPAPEYTAADIELELATIPAATGPLPVTVGAADPAEDGRDVIS